MKPFCYRTFDFRNRFEQPFPTALEALKVLYSELAYLPEMGHIKAYFENGYELEVDSDIYLIKQQYFEHPDEATKWLLKRNKSLNNDEYQSIPAYGFALSYFNAPIQGQLEHAMSLFHTELDKVTPIDLLAERIEKWVQDHADLASPAL